MKTFLWLLLALASGPVWGALTLQLTPTNHPVAVGSTVTFSGLLTNTSTTAKLFLNDLQATLTAGTTTLKSNTFFANVPGILLPGESYSGPLFAVKLEASAAAANYTGSVTLQGGADIFASDVLGTSGITLLATPVDQWRFRTFGDNATSAAAADSSDYDHDGVPNLLEYALGMNATTMDRTSLPQPVPLNDHLTLSYVPAATDVTYIVEASSDLIQWSAANVELLTVANPNPPGSVTYQYHTPLSGLPRIFLRVRVTR